jgi:hypothetical protein
MRRESHVRFCESGGVKFPSATRRLAKLNDPNVNVPNGPNGGERARTVLCRSRRLTHGCASQSRARQQELHGRDAGETRRRGGYWTAQNTANLARTYDVSLDGQRFLRIKPVASQDRTSVPGSFVIVQNWLHELTRRVPAN